MLEVNSYQCNQWAYSMKNMSVFQLCHQLRGFFFPRTLLWRLPQLCRCRASLTALSLLRSARLVRTGIRCENLGTTSCVSGSLVKSKWRFYLVYINALCSRMLLYLNFCHLQVYKTFLSKPLTFSKTILCYKWCLCRSSGTEAKKFM